MTKSLFEQYASYKLQIAELEAKIEELQPLILAEMPENTPVKLTDVGIFSLGSRKSWTFPEDVESIRTDLKAKEKLSQQVGTATFVEKPYLLFKCSAKES